MSEEVQPVVEIHVHRPPVKAFALQKVSDRAELHHIVTVHGTRISRYQEGSRSIVTVHGQHDEIVFTANLLAGMFLLEIVETRRGTIGRKTLRDMGGFGF